MALTFTLDPADPAPLYLQVARRLRDAVAAGTLKPGARLPAARALAGELSVARGTIDAAYAVLAGEGAIQTRRGSGGTIVSADFKARLVEPVQPTLLLERPAAPDQTIRPFRMGLPALDAFPRKTWTALTVRAARAIGAEAMAYADPAGLPALRQAIAAYLGVARGFHCGAERIVITAGFQGALALARQVLLKQGDPVWIEDPAYPLTRQSLEAAGARLVPVRVDRQGMRVASGRVAAPRARLAVVTPAHQSPLGVALSLPRRLELLSWASEANAWILEDDYDGEFHYTGRPLQSLKSLDRTGRVLYCGSFSKTLHPALRLGYLVLPDELVPSFVRSARLLTGGPPALEQRVVARFMEEGHFARHLRRMRVLYGARRDALARALAVSLDQRYRIETEAGGLHILVRPPEGVDDTELARRANDAGLAVTALSGLAIAHPCGGGLLLGFTNIAVEDAPAMARRLAEALGAPARDGTEPKA